MKRIAATLFGIALGTWLLAPAMATDGTSGSSGYATKDRETINQTPCGATGCVFDSQSPPHYVVHGSEMKTATGHGTITENQICSAAGQQFVNIATSTDTATGTSTSAGTTASVTGTSTSSQTAAASSTVNGTATAACSSGEFSQTVASTATKTGSVTGTATGTATITGTSTASVTGSGTGTVTCSNTVTASNTWTGTDSQTKTGVAWYITGTCTETDTATRTYTGVATIGLTATVTLTSTGSITSTASNTMPCSGTWTYSSTSTATDTCALGSQSTLSTTSTAVQGTGTDNRAAIWADTTSLKASSSITEGTDGTVYVSLHEDNASGPTAVMRKSRGTEGSPSALVDGDVLGNMRWQGYVDSDYLIGAQVSAVADSWDVPPYQRRTRLEFTVSDDAGTLASGATLNSFGLDVTGKVTDDASTVVCSTGMSCAGVTVTGTGTATGTGTGTFRLLAYGVPLTLSSTSTYTYTHTHTSTDVSGVAASTHTHTEVFALPQATVTATVPGTATFAATAIGTTTPSASAIPIAGTDSKLATGWLPGKVTHLLGGSVLSSNFTSDYGYAWSTILSNSVSSAATDIIVHGDVSPETYPGDGAAYCTIQLLFDATHIGSYSTTTHVDDQSYVGLTAYHSFASGSSHTVYLQIQANEGARCYIPSGWASLTVQELK